MTEFLTKITEASRAGRDLTGRFASDRGSVYVQLHPVEDDDTLLDGHFSLRELDAIVRYKRSQL